MWINLRKEKTPTSCRGFSYWVLWYNSCRTSHSLYLILLFLSGASCSLCLHDKKSAWGRIAAKGGNCCAPKRTKLFKFYPKGYPQKLGIIWAVYELIMHTKVSFWLNINQFYWQEVSNLLIKKPTCFQAGFLGLRPQFLIA